MGYRILFFFKFSNPPNPPFLKGGEGGLICIFVRMLASLLAGKSLLLHYFVVERLQPDPVYKMVEVLVRAGFSLDQVN